MNSSTPVSKKRLGTTVAGMVCFALCLLLLDRGAFYLIHRWETRVYRQKDFEARFARYIKERTRDKKYDTLIFGSSRTYEGIHPYYIDKLAGGNAFKESYQGKGPRYFYHFYQLFKKYNGPPKVVIYGMDYFIYTINSQQKYMARFSLDKKLAANNIDYLRTPLLLVKYKDRIDKFMNSIKMGIKDTGNIKELFKELDKLQSYRAEGKQTINLITKRPPKHRRQRYPRYPGNEGDDLKKLLEELHRDNVAVLLVNLPDHIGTYKTNFQRKWFVNNLKRWEEEFSNVHMLNYNRPGAFPLDRHEFFMDGGWGKTNSHLSKEGARFFNQKLCKDLAPFYK